ncbi:uncharacterized protein HD556DRAFT_1304785 [Suillus plorans]|uniref:SAP domain-containing protein n=1 Tax=Suillus plorans TaxID=116603 RepID=A0A9P7DQX8_9AGAM|nr:uncharacterized protein HD556DRAFT_1304785 [Suillus plorans]KAG1800776.1 hypothetical protein HD556DRAFT_1304785 [Suillus plorans]
MDVVSTTGSHPSSDDNEAFWSPGVGMHDRTTSNTTLGSPQNSALESTSSHEQSLPFPRRFRREGEPLVQRLYIYNMTVKVLRQHCNEFDLHQTGNKTMLIEQLEEFSREPDSWDRLRPGACKSHKGPRASRPTDMARTGRTKQSTQRCAQLVSTTAATAVADRSKDTHTSTKVAALLPWTEMIAREYPYQPMDLVPPVAGAESSHTLLTTNTSALSVPYIDEDAIIQNVSAKIVSLVQDALHEPGTAQSPPILDAERITHSGAEGTTHSSAKGITHSSAEIVASECGAPRESSTGKPRLLQLGDGTVLQVDASEIPDPPAISFDDHTEHWKGLSVIVIRGHPITVEYWPLLYRYGKEQQWQSTKNKWNDWRVIVKCYHQDSPEQFWATFSAKGERMKYTTIVQKLRDMRMSIDSRIA